MLAKARIGAGSKLLTVTKTQCRRAVALLDERKDQHVGVGEVDRNRLAVAEPAAQRPANLERTLQPADFDKR